MKLLNILGGIVALVLAASAVAILHHTVPSDSTVTSIKSASPMNELKKPELEMAKSNLSPAPSVKTSVDLSLAKFAETAPSNQASGVRVSPKSETAILAGGCFWGMEEILRKIPGVIETKVGYTGGATVKPTYRQICTGTSGHAEAIQIVFDPNQLNYEQLLGYFFRMHDPTTKNQQHNDIGTQYRSAIFFTSDEQRQTAEHVKVRVDKSGKWKNPLVTEITQAVEFYPAEDYHQKYLVTNPGGYNCHVLRE